MAGSHDDKNYEVFNGVSTRDVPSAGFGYSRVSRATIQLAGWFSVFTLLMYNFGNHTGHVETIWLVVLAAITALGLLFHLFEPKLNQVRTLTGHNKPVGHQEPDWAYLQKTLSGSYSKLTDSQLRALNIDPARVAHLRAGASDDGSTPTSLTEGSTASQKL